MGKQRKIGKIVGFHGLRGDVKVRPASPEPDWVDTIEQVTLVMPQKTLQLTVSQADFQDRLVFLRFEGHPDRTSVEPYVGAELMADEANLPKPEEDEYYIDQLIGLAVVDAKTGGAIGVVKDVISSTGQDFLEIQVDGSETLQVVPIVEHFVADIDPAQGQIRLQNLEGFFDEI